MSNATFEMSSAQNNRTTSKKNFQSLGAVSDPMHANGGIQSAKKLFEQPKSQQEIMVRNVGSKHYVVKTASGHGTREKVS